MKGYCCDSAGSSERLSLPQKQNTRGQNGGLVWPPQHDSPGSWQGGREARIRAPPCTNTDGVVGHQGSSHEAFIPEKLISGECGSFPIEIGALPEPCVAELNPGSTDMFPQTRLFCFGAASLRTSPRWVQTLLWEDQAGSAHTRCSVTIQTRTKTVSNGQNEETWVKK